MLRLSCQSVDITTTYHDHGRAATLKDLLHGLKQPLGLGDVVQY
jgi:hypothetical protein